MRRHLKFARMAALAFENALQLHANSIHLFARRSYGSAMALSILAAEEIGKYFWVEDLVWHSVVEGPWPPEHQETWLKGAYDHGLKQRQFAWAAKDTLPRKIFKRISEGALERDKQRGFYVGLPRRGKDLDLLARVSSPHLISRRFAEAQITSVNDFFVVFAVGCASETLGLDIPVVEEMLTLKLARSLLRRWPRMHREAKHYILRLMPELARASRFPRTMILRV